MMDKAMAKIKCIGIAFLAVCMLIGLVTPEGSAYLTSIPPFVEVGMKPNVLIVLDNSNSMDEDFSGNGVGSYYYKSNSVSSKSISARVAIQNILTTNKNSLRAGLMTFQLGGVSYYYIHNSPYFASYDPQSYCPNKDAGSDCVTYCQTGSSTSRTACMNECRQGDSTYPGNPLFNPDYFDEILTYYAIGTEPHSRYCNLVYPKFQTDQYISSDGTVDTPVYYKNAYPFYDGGDDGTQFCYSSSYNAEEGNTPWDYYQCYYDYTLPSDGYTIAPKAGGPGYSVSGLADPLGPTDSDYANGYQDFGRRLAWVFRGPAWFCNSSPGGGSLRTPISDLVDANGNNTTTFNNLMSELSPYINDPNGYMSCSGNPNSCSYIINAGLTPTLGTLENAASYFSGSTSPIQGSCQQNSIVVVTDGMPDTDSNGNIYSSSTDAINAVVAEIKTLAKMNIKVYVLGVGSEAQGNLDAMAQAAGTQDANGHAFYASSSTDLQNALNQIFSEIVVNVGTAGAVATVSQQATVGDLIVRGSFKAYDTSNPNQLIWQGHLESYWSCPGCSSLTTQSACLANSSCTCTWSDNHCEGEYAFQSGSASPTTNTNPTFCADFVDKTCWDAGTILTSSSQSGRNIFTYINGTQTSFTTANASTLAPYLQNTIDFVVAGCSSYSNQTSCNAASGCGWNSSTSKCTAQANSTDVPDLISWVRGDTTYDGSTARNRQGWILGDIVYSTPVIVQAPALAYLPPTALSPQTATGFGNCAASAPTDPCTGGCSCSSSCATQCFECYMQCQQYREQMAYVGGNDGMLHAFVIGKWENNQWVYDHGIDSEIGTEKWAYIPGNILSSLQQLAMCDYGTTCNGVKGPQHRYMVDLAPQPREVYISVNGGPRQWRTVLVGGEEKEGTSTSRST